MHTSFTNKRSDDLRGLTEPFLIPQPSQKPTVDLVFTAEVVPASFFLRLHSYSQQDFAANLLKVAAAHSCHKPHFIDVAVNLQPLLQGNLLVLLQSVPVASGAISACKQLEQAVNRTYARCSMRPLPFRSSCKSGDSTLDKAEATAPFQLQVHKGLDAHFDFLRLSFNELCGQQLLVAVSVAHGKCWRLSEDRSGAYTAAVQNNQPLHCLLAGALPTESSKAAWPTSLWPIHKGIASAAIKVGLQEFASAMSDLSRADRRQPNTTSVQSERGIIHLHRGCFQDAADMFSRASSAGHGCQRIASAHLKLVSGASASCSGAGCQQLSSIVPLPFASYADCSKGGLFIAQLATGSPLAGCNLADEHHTPMLALLESLLQRGSVVCQIRASAVLGESAQLCKAKAHLKLLDKLTSASTDVTTVSIAALCSIMDQQPNIKESIGTTTVISSLVELLQSPASAVKVAAATMLCSLANHHPGRKALIAQADGLAASVRLLQAPAGSVQQKAATLLQTLATGDAMLQDRIVESGCIPALVGVLQGSAAEAAAQVLAALSAGHVNNQTVITGHAAIPALSKLLRCGSSAEQLAAAQALYSLMHHQPFSVKAAAEACVPAALVPLIASRNSRLRSEAALAWQTIACSHPGVRRAMHEAGGAHELAKAFIEAELQECGIVWRRGAAMLRSICCGPQDAADMYSAVRLILRQLQQQQQQQNQAAQEDQQAAAATKTSEGCHIEANCPPSQPSGDDVQLVSDLATCYDLISPRLQSALLDAACFAEGLDATTAEALWFGTDFAATLQSLGLLKHKPQPPDRPACLHVPEFIRKLALKQADQAWARRVVPSDDALALLDFSKVDRLPHVEVVVAPPRVKLTPQMLLNLPDLRMLLAASFDKPDFRPSQAYKASNMGHMRLQNLCLLESVGPDFPSQLELPALNVLILKHIKERLPDRLPTFISLQALFIHSEFISALPPALGRLTRLQTLDCTGCTSLQGLSDSLGDLKNLTTLRLDACLQLAHLPDSLTRLCALRTLTMGACAAFQALPAGLGAMHSLAALELSGCTSLVSLPQRLEGLTNLTRLIMGACTSLTSLPDSVGSLSKLQILDLQGCWSLNALPASVRELASLKLLDTQGRTGPLVFSKSKGQLWPCQSETSESYSSLAATGLEHGPDIWLHNLRLLSKLGFCSYIDRLPERVWCVLSNHLCTLEGHTAPIIQKSGVNCDF
ncbi:hypothetical protein WJX74_001691 [Apatococcus lobatus]|uniref:Uncharacterized protein n=1 Tax=Apatococcus lobatus TaxID=904363 RepID=A0AAW1QP77_9CHLO